MKRAILFTALFLLAAGCASTRATVQQAKGVKLVGNQITIEEHINFESGKAAILPDSHDLLRRIATVLKANPDIARLRIEGHTDKTGASDFNKQLSEQRAVSVADFLGTEGVKMEIVSEGYGDEKPLCEEETDDCHSKNRRVEFYVERG